jgi:uncharacterized membrane protein YecN with MAPEG domain
MYPLTSLATIAAVVLFTALVLAVGAARAKYKVAAPAMTGDIEFEKRSRVQVNTLEQLAVALPAMWLCAVWAGDVYGGVGGAIWVAGRVLYARAYACDPKKRGPGFMIAFFATAAMLIAAAVQIVRDLI